MHYGRPALKSEHIIDHDDQGSQRILLAVEYDEPKPFSIASRSANTLTMSDSFADLWKSSTPTKPVQPAQKLGSPPINNAPRRAQHDVFSMLSSAGSSNPSSRSLSPAVSGLPPQRTTTPNLATKSVSNGGDAFSGLLGRSLAAGTNGNSGKTMAERAADAERQKLESLRRHQQPVKPPTSNTWDGLDSLAKPSAQSDLSLATKPGQALLDDDWGLAEFASRPISRAAAAQPTVPPVPAVSADDDDWLSDFKHNPISQPKPQAFEVSSQNFRDDNSSPPPLPTRRRADSPGDFDFGNREDALLGDDSNDEDDILGALSKPVDAIPKRRSPPATARNTPPVARTYSGNGRNGTPVSRPVSPPPHILGQIVEMGFSIQQARIALAATDSGLDVEAALETLLSNGAASGDPVQPSLQSPEFQAPRSGARLMPQDREQHTPSPGGSQQDRERDIREQADKLLAQASEIGLSVFSKASSFWKEGKERVQKAYVEHAAPAGSSSASTGRPKWMTEQPHEEGEDPWKDGLREPGGGFSDEVEPTSERAKPQQQQPQRPKPKPKPKPTTADLFSDDPQPAPYVSPFRRRAPAAAPVAPAASTPRATPPPPPPPPRAAARPPSPPRRRSNLVSAPPSALATANKHKDAGSAKFKLGQYAEAEASYTSGIDALPSGHLLLVPLHNNRALARLRTGDHAGAVTDAGAVLELVGTGYHPKREVKVEKVEEGGGVDLGDALVKALKRRAEAWEGREKWEEAAKDWGTLAGLDWAAPKAKGEAARAVGRCRKTIAQNKEVDTGEAAPKPVLPRTKPKPPVKPAALSRPAPPSQALENLRTASNAAEAEDQLRHELKDTVDAKLTAWKGGKETNIRALLGSLDLVLWPELGLQKVGMAELVTPSQVKIKYTRTIAKLHPDKLNSGNTTVEQRMLANSVFGALNEAWNAFKN
ncbi:hypothetical protein DXG01_005176 [Tephrocybe rancida]|nr:hypothetical protein DXG01_005176 [Tephrocybe rancida]